MEELTSKPVRITFHFWRDAFPSADVFFGACTNLGVPSEVSFPRAWSLFTNNSGNGSRATPFNIVHHLEGKLRRLELKMFVAATFGVAPVRFLQNRIPSLWFDTIPQFVF